MAKDLTLGEAKAVAAGFPPMANPSIEDVGDKLEAMLSSGDATEASLLVDVQARAYLKIKNDTRYQPNGVPGGRSD